MDRAALGDIELEYELHGVGEPVLLIHPGHFADWFTLLLHERALTNRYQLVHYHRVGCAGSSRIAGPVPLSRHGRDARSLLQSLRISRAHVVGHSSIGNVALQMAIDFPECVHSLAILEPALMSVPAAATSDQFADAETFFEQEMPALQQWSFGQSDAMRISQPVLAVVGARSLEMDPIWGERHQLLLDWLPRVEPFVLPDATHLLQVMNPRGMPRVWRRSCRGIHSARRAARESR